MCAKTQLCYVHCIFSFHFTFVLTASAISIDWRDPCSSPLPFGKRFSQWRLFNWCVKVTCLITPLCIQLLINFFPFSVTGKTLEENVLSCAPLAADQVKH